MKVAPLRKRVRKHMAPPSPIAARMVILKGIRETFDRVLDTERLFDVGANSLIYKGLRFYFVEDLVYGGKPHMAAFIFYHADMDDHIDIALNDFYITYMSAAITYREDRKEWEDHIDECTEYDLGLTVKYLYVLNFIFDEYKDKADQLIKQFTTGRLGWQYRYNNPPKVVSADYFNAFAVKGVLESTRNANFSFNLDTSGQVDWCPKSRIYKFNLVGKETGRKLRLMIDDLPHVVRYNAMTNDIYFEEVIGQCDYHFEVTVDLHHSVNAIASRWLRYMFNYALLDPNTVVRLENVDSAYSLTRAQIEAR